MKDGRLATSVGSKTDAEHLSIFSYQCLEVHKSINLLESDWWNLTCVFFLLALTLQSSDDVIIIK